MDFSCCARVVAPTTLAGASFLSVAELSSSLYSGSRKLSLKSSESLFFLSGGDGSGTELVASSSGILLTSSLPSDEFGWTGVFPREGVKSAFKKLHHSRLVEKTHHLFTKHSLINQANPNFDRYWIGNKDYPSSFHLCIDNYK